MLQPNAFNRLVSKVVVENVVGLAKVRFNWCRVLKQRRVPLIAVATDEAVEVFESQSGWPKIKRPSLTRHPVGHIVHLAKPECVVPESGAFGPLRSP